MPDYLALASQCRTQNEFNRLHIDLENVLAPRELAQIARLRRLPTASLKQLTKIGNLCPQLLDAPNGFERRALVAQITAYEGSDVTPGEKSVLIAFCGNAGRLMMPVAVFLQFIDPRRWDVIVLRKRTATSYIGGPDGVSADFPGLVRYLHTAAGVKPYARVVTFGMSGGAYAAVLAAVSMGAKRGVSICGGLPKSGLSALPSSAQEPRDLRLVYGAGSTRDRESAIALADVFGGILHPIRDADTHNVLSVLLKRGELSAFLGEMLI